MESARAMECTAGRLRLVPAWSVPLRLTRFDGCMAAAWCALVALEAVLSRRVHLAAPQHLVSMVPWLELGILAAAMLVCCVRPVPRVVHAARLLVWSALWVNPLSFLMQLAARSRFGLVDGQLAAIDARMHMSTAAIHGAMSSPPLVTCSILAYVMFIPLLAAAVTVPCLCGYAGASRRFIVGVVLGMWFGAALFVFFPAVGPWAVEAMKPSSLQAVMGDYLVRLKSGMPMRAEMAHAAIVSFPSEHVIVAILAAQALGAVRALRTPAWVLCVLVCVSTLTTGWHYAIDGIGGVVVACVSVYLADCICRSLEERDAVCA